MSSPGPLVPPTPSWNDLLLQARALLLDPTQGPSVPSLLSGGTDASRLTDVRISGKGVYQGVQVGTQGWDMLSSGFPVGMLTLARPKKTEVETGRVWQDATCWLHIALTGDRDPSGDPLGWALDWDAELMQWFPFHYRMGFTTSDNQPNADLHWTYEEAIPTTFTYASQGFYGLVCRLNIHLVTRVTYGT